MVEHVIESYVANNVDYMQFCYMGIYNQIRDFLVVTYEQNIKPKINIHVDNKMKDEMRDGREDKSWSV